MRVDVSNVAQWQAFAGEGAGVNACCLDLYQAAASTDLVRRRESRR